MLQKNMWITTNFAEYYSGILFITDYSQMIHFQKWYYFVYTSLDICTMLLYNLVHPIVTMYSTYVSTYVYPMVAYK